ncbi:MAG: fumarate hydratase, partial [Spirochaetales bacterium]|nr:fumarate hydratase [Candidatus Physcosoma equi]
VKEILEKAGAKPCPPVFLGVGVGGTMDRAAVLSKKAFFKKGAETPLEKRIKDEINQSGIGPGGLGGLNTCLSVRIMDAPTHIAGLPVAVTVNCWAERKITVVLKGGYDGEEA